MEKLEYFQYGADEIEYLKSRDPVLGAAIDEIGHIQRPVTPDLFQALVSSIVGQQISTRAQETVLGRIKDKLKQITPETIDSISVEEVQAFGMTMRKATYIKEMTSSILTGDLVLSELYNMTDGEVCKYLCQIKGIGKWTAEMVMTFSMQRPNIISYGDLAIQRGLRMLYNQDEITPSLFDKYRRLYSPHATVASLYIWAIAGGALPHLVDPANS